MGLSASSSFFFVGCLDVVAGASEDVGGFEDCCRACQLSVPGSGDEE